MKAAGPSTPEPVDAVEFAADRAAEHGVPLGESLPPAAEVRPGVWVLPQPTPGDGIPHYTLSYAIVDEAGGVHLVDPGWDTEENADRLAAFLADRGARLDDVVSVTATHLHPDHLGLAERLRRETGARVQLHAAEQEAAQRLAEQAETAVETAAERLALWGVPEADRDELMQVARVAATAGPRTTAVSTGVGPAGFTADLVLHDGELLEVPGRRLEVLHTPGHTPGHLALVDHGDELLFTGDLVLPTIYPGLGLGGPADDPLGDYLRSLERVSAYAGHEVLPGHGYRFTGIAARCATIREHHLKRSREIAALLDAHPGLTVWQLAERVTWTAGWAHLHGFYRVSALSQTAMHTAYLQRAEAA
ncbi:MBL fold metallo-hydrolase [Herbiconiux sp. KACC 21604]|uniref:MBL fold metallo-hydrolase n=1 Tax=unclassified Herbiconiux TaxID=2618217 RepID=UPI0014916F38|nr:MBL fold metallo-hydrolase [Herbiconiux sp. SALV-R1]QJU55424.1 MBL fold metallo-hydrolase [Herbiconiux sp. SALV-R1]WPO86603.1 MBL fold metallo-hydrolase [Herbiconiux sp. KACC 21604]